RTVRAQDRIEPGAVLSPVLAVAEVAVRTLFAVGLVLALAPVAAANPLSLARFGGLRGDPTTQGAFALWWNPAGLAGPGWDAALDAQLLVRQASYDRDADLNMIPDTQRAANAGLARVSTVGAVPALFGRWGKSVRH